MRASPANLAGKNPQRSTLERKSCCADFSIHALEDRVAHDQGQEFARKTRIASSLPGSLLQPCIAPRSANQKSNE
jgi:hypothetical protein